MCRLIASTETELNHAMRSVLFESLILRSLGDEYQAYGTGISDTASIIKSGDSPLYCDIGEWASHLDMQYPWFAHLRKPSAGVAAASAFAAHPYAFKKSRLITAHNGYIAGAKPEKAEEGKPYVDSYYAFERLDAIVDGNPLDRDHLAEWIKTMGPGSEYSFMLSQDRDLWIIRGIRTLYWTTLNNGRVYCTSADVLRSTAQSTSRWWPRLFTWGPKIELIPEHTAINTTTGRHFKLPAPPLPAYEPKALTYTQGEWKDGRSN